MPHTVRTILLLLLMGITVDVVSGQVRDMALAPGDPAPRLLGYSIETGRVRNVDWSTHPLTLVNFWATWCVPCFDEMPDLQKLHERWGEHGLRVIGLNTQRDLVDKQIGAFLLPFGITYEVLRIHRMTDNDWPGLALLPTSFLVDAEGRIVRRYVGATSAQREGMRHDIESAMNGLPLPPQPLPGDGTEADHRNLPERPVPKGTASPSHPGG